MEDIDRVSAEGYTCTDSMTPPQQSKVPLRLRLVLSVAAMAIVFAVADLGAALVERGWQLPQDARYIRVPFALALLGILSWLLALSRLQKQFNRLQTSRVLNALFALFGMLCALIAGADLVSALADAGVAALLDVSLLFIGLSAIVLGTWCAVAGTTNLARANRHDAS